LDFRKRAPVGVRRGWAGVGHDARLTPAFYTAGASEARDIDRIPWCGGDTEVIHTLHQTITATRDFFCALPGFAFCVAVSLWMSKELAHPSNRKRNAIIKQCESSEGLMGGNETQG
jgi:hypothetical protein